MDTVCCSLLVNNLLTIPSIKIVSKKKISLISLSMLMCLFLAHTETDLPPLPRWRMVFITARFLESNWAKGHYNVLPHLKAHRSRVTAFDSNGEWAVIAYVL